MKIVSYQTRYPDGTVVATCYTDAKTDATSESIEALKLSSGSVIYTKDMDIGVVDSTGTVNWTE